MAWAGDHSYSAEFGEERHDFRAASLFPDIAIVSSEKANGSYGIQLDYDTNAFNCMFDSSVIGPPSNKAGWFCSMWVKLGSGTITNPIPLLTHNRGAGPGDEFIIVNTDKTVTLQDYRGNILAKTTAMLSSSVWTHLFVTWDETLNTVYGVIAFDGVAKASGEGVDDKFFDTSAHSGQTIHFGGKRGSGNCGIKVYLDDCDLQKSASPSGDMPWDRQFPKLRGYGGAMRVPTANGDESDWDNSLCGAGSEWQFVDEVPWGTADDCVAGSGDYIATNVPGKRQTFHYGTGNPIPFGYDIEHVAMRCIYRQVDDTKDRASFTMKLNGTVKDESGVFIGGNSYRGEGRWNIPRPGGGSWTRADFDLSAGKSKLQFGVKADDTSTNDRVAALYMPEVFAYDPNDKITLLTPPPVAAGLHERHYPHGTMRGVLRGAA